MEKLHTALLSAFSENELTRLVRFRLNLDLAAIVSKGTYKDVVFDLITAAL
jgi:hypothetical protein